MSRSVSRLAAFLRLAIVSGRLCVNTVTSPVMFKLGFCEITALHKLERLSQRESIASATKFNTGKSVHVRVTVNIRSKQAREREREYFISSEKFNIAKSVEAQQGRERERERVLITTRLTIVTCVCAYL